MPFDFFVGHLKCPRCKHISAADMTTNMQTQIREKPLYECFGVGATLEITPHDLWGGGYEPLNKHSPREDLILIEMWDCPHCGLARNWAQIVINPGGTITNISTVENREDILKKAHYIVDECAHDINYYQ